MPPADLNRRLADRPVTASAPCRIDLGGTLDIGTFHLPLRHFGPATFNIALSLRTRVRLLPWEPGRVRISSRGFDSVEYPADALPFDHPLGLMCAVAAYFAADGVHVEIASASPPRSALGGSSVAAVALAAAFDALREPARGAGLSRGRIAELARDLEGAVAGVPCGLQDQLAAAYGGVNLWRWPRHADGRAFERREVIDAGGHRRLERRLLVAYCGRPHVSSDVNGRWVRQFLAGRHRPAWREIVRLCHDFSRALAAGDLTEAAAAMNREVDLRMEMTPDVLEPTGQRLVAAARRLGCGARFTGAGGGGCLWALGPAERIGRLRGEWERLLAPEETATLLPTRIDARGVELEGPEKN